MAETFNFQLVSPERVLVSADVSEVIVPGLEGDLTVLPKHAPVIALMRPGILRVPEIDGTLKEIYVRGGLVDVSPDTLSVLAEYAAPLADVNKAFLASEISNAEEELSDAQNESKKRQAVDTLERLQSLNEVLL